MIVDKLVQVGNPLLYKRSTIIKNIKSSQTKKIIENLIDSMRFFNMIWAAGVQIWENKRIFVTEIKHTLFRKSKDLDPLKIYINPCIISYSKSQCIIYEWCWSVANMQLFGPVKRPREILIEAFDENWDKFRLKASWLLSRVIQHEYDHINGKIFVEKITDIKKIMSQDEYIKKFHKQ